MTLICKPWLFVTLLISAVLAGESAHAAATQYEVAFVGRDFPAQHIRVKAGAPETTVCLNSGLLECAYSHLPDSTPQDTVNAKLSIDRDGIVSIAVAREHDTGYRKFTIPTGRDLYAPIILVSTEHHRFPLSEGFPFEIKKPEVCVIDAGKSNPPLFDANGFFVFVRPVSDSVGAGRLLVKDRIKNP